MQPPANHNHRQLQLCSHFNGKGMARQIKINEESQDRKSFFRVLIMYNLGSQYSAVQVKRMGSETLVKCLFDGIGAWWEAWVGFT